ncbi:DUF2490 domain-containing protein [Patiriisocius hiemis]|uniref:DUF2490 domain-containing protein n=1 Tax=Patiriisocius hiemis TaxID=3075604 RepID=A0ABU2YA11_9FLAO|nr:DUF2490 domain-containing protein [Constantimarinum sp. W242]MDT0554681.1 DUF2490 domain-containing protein [Constantimarinum sp. W242]
MKITKSILFIFLITLITKNSFAQNDPSDEFGAWYIFATNNKITDKFSIQAQTQFRYFELTSEIQQFKIRTSGTLRIMPGLRVAVGYAYFRNDFSYQSTTPAAFDEHRIVEDILFDHNIGKVKVFQRARLENRFIVRNGDTDFRNWYRHEAKLVYPINEEWSIDLYDEIWLNIGDEPTFAQNWLGTGVSYKISEAFKARLGYQRIHLDGPDFDRLIVGLTLTNDFRKKEDNQ